MFRHDRLQCDKDLYNRRRFRNSHHPFLCIFLLLYHRRSMDFRRCNDRFLSTERYKLDHKCRSESQSLRNIAPWYWKKETAVTTYLDALTVITDTIHRVTTVCVGTAAFQWILYTIIYDTSFAIITNVLDCRWSTTTAIAHVILFLRSTVIVF